MPIGVRGAELRSCNRAGLSQRLRAARSGTFILKLVSELQQGVADLSEMGPRLWRVPKRWIFCQAFREEDHGPPFGALQTRGGAGAIERDQCCQP